MRLKWKYLFSITLLTVLFLSLLSIKSYAITSADPTASTLKYDIQAKDSNGTSYEVKEIWVTGDVTNKFNVGDTIKIGNDPYYEYRDIRTITYDGADNSTQITFDYLLEYDHSAGDNVFLGHTEPVVSDTSITVGSGGGSKGSKQISISDSKKILKVGDTILINPGQDPVTYNVTAKSGDRVTLTLTSVANISVGDAFVAKKSGFTDVNVIVQSVDSLNSKVVVNTPINFNAPFDLVKYVIEKSQIIGIQYNQSTNAPETLLLKAALKVNHSSGEPILLTNTAASMYEHDSGFANNQSNGSQPTKIANPNGTNKVTVYETRGPHGKYTSNTNACGRCHQLHAAPSPNLIRLPITASINATNPIYATCTFCHNFNGQSTYDVKNGQIWDTSDGKRYATNGGGFERMLVVEGDPQNATLVKATSKHMVNTQAKYNNGSYEYVRFNAPGGPSPVQGHIELTCTRCHQPHGTKNGRQLVETIDGLDTSRWETGGTNGAVIVKVENPFEDEKTKYSAEIVDFCGACHVDYATAAGGREKTGANSQKYRHRMNMAVNTGYNNRDALGGTLDLGLNQSNIAKLILPTATEGDGAGVVICLTCHYAHGTFTKTEGIKQYDELKVNATTSLNTVGGWESAKNLRLDNRGVCQNCHNRNADKTPPILTNILDPTFDGSDSYGSEKSLLNQKAGSFTDDSIMIRFNQYMWTNPGVKNFTNYPYDTENSINYVVTKDGGPLTVKSVKLQPDGRTVVLYFTSGTISTGNYTVKVNNGADLNWNYVNSADPANTVTFSK